MNPSIPAPGGAVGLKTFGVYVAGGTAGLVVFANYVLDPLPDSWTEWSVGPIKGVHVWMTASVLLGAALAAKFAGGHK